MSAPTTSPSAPKSPTFTARFARWLWLNTAGAWPKRTMHVAAKQHVQKTIAVTAAKFSKERTLTILCPAVKLEIEVYHLKSESDVQR
jgi:hypothetical protein